MYNKYKTNYYKNILKTVSKNYKKTLSRHYMQYKNDKISKLRALKRNNSREYWRIINTSHTTHNTEANIHDFFDYFKNLNEINNDKNKYNNIDISEGYQTNETAEIELNQHIMEHEVLASVKLLKNSKAPGPDSIVNEHIKSTVHIMLPTYVNLFNLVFDYGIIPESWTVGTIKPIFKHKVDPKLPENYRPITLLSSFGKLFTLIINNRLQKYADKYNIMNDTQTGFRKGYSTSNNLFILKSLIDILHSKKKILYCCFIDFK